MQTLLEDTSTDIAILTESWLTPDIHDNELRHSNTHFTSYRLDRNRRREGGILVFVKDSLPSQTVTISTNFEILCVEIILPTCKNILIACYRAPDCDHSFTDDLQNVLFDLTSRFPHANFLLCGDFNYPDIDWDNLCASSRQSRDFLELCLLFNLSQSVTMPTRGTTTLDLVLVSNPDLIQSVSCIPGLSDHNVVLFSLSIALPSRRPSKKLIRDFNNANFSTINSELNKFLVSFTLSASTRTVDQNWLLFKRKLLTLIDNHVPLIRVPGDAQRPWYSNLLKKLSQKKKRLFRAAKNFESISKWNRYFACLREYTHLLKRSKKKFFHNDLLNIARTNPKKFWKLLNPKNNTHNISLTNSDGSHVPLPQRADVMNTYFTSVFTSEPLHSIPVMPRSNFSPMPPIDITFEGISSLIKKLKISSSPGPDNIPAKVLKATNIISSKFLEIIFKQSISEGFIPDDWKLGKVVPVFKSGKRSDPSNYRPISLTCIACKLMEHIIYSHVARHLDDHSFFFHKQHGFRSGLSCETQLFEFMTDLHLNLDSSFQTDVIFVDFSKAFDLVPHQRLINKLSSLSLDPLTLSWIKCFLTHRSQFTVIGGAHSDTTPVISGVPQGSVLGPLLFLIYVNDLPSGISSTVRLFADDCVIYRRISTPEDQLILQQDLHIIDNWCAQWMMRPNTSKCKFMPVSRKHTNVIHPYSLNSTVLSQVDSYRYLGVVITSRLTWTEHITKLAADASKTLGYLRRSLSLSPASLRKLAFETFVRTKMEYASAIWSPHQIYLINILESVQNRAARFISANYDKRASISQIKSSLGLPVLSARRKISRLCLFHKLYYSFPHLHGSLLLPPVRTSRRLFNSLSIQRLFGSTNAFNKSFLPTAIDEWNGLTDAIVSEQVAVKFRDLLLATLDS